MLSQSHYYNHRCMFKIRKKQKSVPKSIHVTSNQAIQQLNRYRCLKQISNTEQHWKRLVENELQMASTIVAFQNVEISMRVDAHKKLMLRQTFMLKKQIIRLILNEKYDEILQKLDVLRKTSSADNILASLFIDFYRIRQEIMSFKLEYRHQTVSKIKQKIQEYQQKIQRQKGSIIFGRILYITALHLIKLDGVLIRNEDIGIVVQALNSKKKQLCMLTSQINKVTLQSLLFLTFEFYKILYLLKRDQDLMTQYYNQIQAYISIYRTKCKNFQDFEKDFKIGEKIEKMQPLNLNLKIYDDHDRRRILSLQNTKQQLMKNHFAARNGNILISQINMQAGNNNRKTLNRINSFESSFEKQDPSQSKLPDSEFCIVKDVSNFALKGGLQEATLSQSSRFCFEFIKPDEPYLYNGKFQVGFNQDLGQFNILINISKKNQIVGLFRLNQIGAQKKRSLSECAKKLWRVVKETFYTDKTQFLPNLFSFEYPPFVDLPKHINKTFQLPILVRIHQILLHYLRKQSEKMKMNGQIIIFPSAKAESEKKLNDPSQAEYKIFAKRHGFISFNKKIRSIHHKSNSYSQDHHEQQQQDQQLRIVFVVKQQSQHSILSVILCKDEIKNFLCVSRNLKGNKNDQAQIKLKQNLIKLYGYSAYLWRAKRISIIIREIQDCKLREEYFVMDRQCGDRNFQTSSIQQQFQVMKSPVLETRHHQIKSYKREKCLAKKISQKQRNKTDYSVIKISGKYRLFFAQHRSSHTRYFDSKIEFITNQLFRQNYEIVYKKFRLYKTVFFKKTTLQNEAQGKASDKGEQFVKLYYIKRKDGEEKEQIMVKKQNIRVEWKKSYIGKKNDNSNGFTFINLYTWKSNLIITVYDFTSFNKYVTIMPYPNNQYELNKWKFDEKNRLLNQKIRMTKLQGDRHNICWAEQFAQQLDHV